MSKFFNAIGDGNLAKVKRFIEEEHMDVNVKNNGGETALMDATAQGYLDIVALLKNAMLKSVQEENAALEKEIANLKVQAMKFKPLTELHKINSVRGR